MIRKQVLGYFLTHPLYKHDIARYGLIVSKNYHFLNPPTQLSEHDDLMGKFRKKIFIMSILTFSRSMNSASFRLKPSDFSLSCFLVFSSSASLFFTTSSWAWITSQPVFTFLFSLRFASCNLPMISLAYLEKKENI